MKQEQLENILDKTLIEDARTIQKCELEYFKILKKYDSDSVYESDPVLTEIQLELGRRQIDGYHVLEAKI